MKVAVIGAGTMGLGIAQVSAQFGFETLLFDVNETALAKAKDTVLASWAKLLEKGKLTEDQVQKATVNFSTTSDFALLKADFIIEAIVEKLEVKQKLFQDLEAQNSETAVFASNTSSLSITKIASALTHKSRFIGLHFFNPATLMQLVEVIAGAESGSEALQKAANFAKACNKTTVQCADSPGFIVNRVARPFYTEALLIAEERIADISEIDDLMEATGFKLGPFRLMDLIGNDINFAVTNSLFDAFYYPARFRPSRMQGQKVDAKHLGKKTGRGFYQY
jgi:3-hydroxybutyryl-CoA dehydrogenase